VAGLFASLLISTNAIFNYFKHARSQIYVTHMPIEGIAPASQHLQGMAS
jgi:hypothetical protein